MTKDLRTISIHTIPGEGVGGGRVEGRGVQSYTNIKGFILAKYTMFYMHIIHNSG
jgi:hypothetical protein